MIPTTKMNLCANLLYYWLQIKNNETNKSEGIVLDTDAFQLWSSEFFCHSISGDDLLQAILTLKNKRLISCHDHKIFIINQLKNQSINNNINHQLPLYDLVELKQYRRDNDTFRWGLIFLASLLILWGGCFWLSMRIAQVSPSSFIVPNSHYNFLLDE